MIATSRLGDGNDHVHNPASCGGRWAASGRRSTARGSRRDADVGLARGSRRRSGVHRSALVGYTGLSAEQAGGWGWTTAVHQDDINRLTTHWQTLLASGAQGEIEARLRRSDGQYRWFLFSAAPLHDDSGRLTGWCGTNIDIDDRHRAEETAREDRKRAEDLLRSSERQFHAIVDNIPAFIAIHNASGELELENRAAQEYHGRSVADTKQWQARRGTSGRLPALIAAHQRALATGQPLELELRLRRADGAYRWFHMRSRRSSDDYDGAARWYTVGTDIHDRKTAEDALRRSETFLLEVQRLSLYWRLALRSGNGRCRELAGDSACVCHSAW